MTCRSSAASGSEGEMGWTCRRDVAWKGRSSIGDVWPWLVSRLSDVGKDRATVSRRGGLERVVRVVYGRAGRGLAGLCVAGEAGR